MKMEDIELHNPGYFGPQSWGESQPMHMVWQALYGLRWFLVGSAIILHNQKRKFVKLWVPVQISSRFRNLGNNRSRSRCTTVNHILTRTSPFPLFWDRCRSASTQRRRDVRIRILYIFTCKFDNFLLFLFQFFFFLLHLIPQKTWYLVTI